jgi:putative transposase
MYAFSEAEREAHGVEPICRVLGIAPSADYVHRQRQADAARQSTRAQRDAVLHDDITRIYDANHAVYGVRKVWRQLQRDGVAVARCTVERLMRAAG